MYREFSSAILFESQSRDLTIKVFAKETLCPVIVGPLSCFVTAWCIANSDPTSQWSLVFCDYTKCTIEGFVKHFQNFGGNSYQHGSIVTLLSNKPFGHLHSTIASLFPCLQRVVLVRQDTSSYSSITHFLPSLSCLHKLTSLKTLTIHDDLLISTASLLPQHCPSLSQVTVTNPVLFCPLVVPNFNSYIYCMSSG